MSKQVSLYDKPPGFSEDAGVGRCWARCRFGLLIGASLLALVLWLRSRKVAVTCYEWLIGILGLLLLLFTIQNFSASFAEHEEIAARMFLLVFGLPAIILLVVACLLPWWRHRRQVNKVAVDNNKKGGVRWCRNESLNVLC